MNTRLSARFAATAAGFGLAALSAAALFGAQGCVVTITDTTDGSTTFDQFVPTDSGKDGAVDSGVNQCNACSYQQCSGQFAACQSQNDCASIYQCATKPNCDQTCVNNCYASFPNGQANYLALASCNKVAGCGVCSSQCNYPPQSCVFPDAGVDSGTDAGSTVQTCTQCTSSKCSAEKTACGTGSDCDAYSQCLAICTDIPCVDACGLAHPTGKAASNDLGNCTQTKCKTECGL